MDAEKTEKEFSEWLTFLENQLMDLRTHQHIYQEIQQIIRDNSKINKPNHFYGWMAVTYASAMSVTVRKLVDKNRRTRSLRRFLEKLHESPMVGRNPVDPSVIKEQIATLERKTKRLKKFVNMRIAHHDQKEFTDFPTFEELDQAIAYLDEVVRQHSSLFGMAIDNLCPPFLYDWKEIFYHPWIDIDEK